MDSCKPEHVYAVIMAGGIGKNLWPLSRKKVPKQFIDLFDEGTMIGKTVDRIKATVSEENIFIITTAQGREKLAGALEHFPSGNIIVEPGIRNTAPCIALATAHIKKRDADAITVVLPSDHLVHDDDTFNQILREGIALAAEKTGLVTIGIKPDRPETDYGYLQADEQFPLPHPFSHGNDFKLYRVKAFAEKPDYATAEQFLESKDFFWNSGVFIWHIDAIAREFERSMPELYKDMLHIYDNLGGENERKVVEDVYSWLHPISIDYGIMEKAETVFVLTGEFGWTDLGNWDEVLKAAAERVPSYRHQDRLLVKIDCENVFVKKPAGKVVCAIGLNDVIIVETDDALLVCGKGHAHRVGGVVDTLRREGMEQYL
ncbi:MAG: mannose-1-phosphate guanyltransferase [Chlorobiaceae bacterium]|nr:mannose-1-phosphate guanyltransferase [Chlorobiaceae bacterium]